MNKTFVTRHRVAVAAASIAAAGALAVPGVAWAQNAIPGGSPVAVAMKGAAAPAVSVVPAAATSADGAVCGLTVTPLTDAELQTLRDGGIVTKESETVSETGESSTVSFSMATATTAAVETDAAPADGEMTATDPVAATTVTAQAC